MADSTSSATGNASEECQTKECTTADAQSQSIQCGETLEDLLSTLSQQIRTSDWLQLNTAEKFAQENPEVAQIFKDVMNKLDSTANKD